MGFSKQEYWSGLVLPPSGDLPDPRVEPGSLVLQAGSSPTELPEKPYGISKTWKFLYLHQKEIESEEMSVFHQFYKAKEKLLGYIIWVFPGDHLRMLICILNNSTKQVD